MYITHLKAMLVKALRETFPANYPVQQWRGLKVGIEFPIAQQDYPSIWVDFEPTGDLETIGIDHVEPVEVTGGSEGYSRWRYQGFATYTVVALSSLERDMLLDEVVSVFTISRANPKTAFRSLIEDNELIAANINFDHIGQRGFSASPGTPWQTDEVIYEATLAQEVIGEYVVSNQTGLLVPITEIDVQEYSENESEPW